MNRKSFKASFLTPILLLALTGMSCRDSLSSTSAVSDRVLWRTGLDPAIDWDGTPAVVGDRLVIAMGPNIAALDKKTGAILWKTRVRENLAPAISSIAIDASSAYLADVSGAVALDIQTGTIRWRTPLDSAAAPVEPAVDDKALYLGTRGEHKVYALSVQDGHLLWAVDVGPDWTYFGAIGGMAVSGDTVFAGVVRYLAGNGYMQSTVVVALNRNSGAEYWRFESPGNLHHISGHPVLAGGLLLGTDTWGGGFFALDRVTGQQKWRVNTIPGFFGPNKSLLVSGDTAFAASGDTYLYSTSLQTGEVFWKSTTHGSIHSSPVLCRGNVWTNTQGLDAFNEMSGRHVLEFLLPDSPEMQAYGQTSEILTSDLATDGSLIFVMSSHAAYAVKC